MHLKAIVCVVSKKSEKNKGKHGIRDEALFITNLWSSDCINKIHSHDTYAFISFFKKT